MTTTYFENAKKATRDIITLGKEKIDEILQKIAAEIVANTTYILLENQKDLDRMATSDPKYDRLKLTEERLFDIANDVKNVSKLNNPLGEIITRKTLENGLDLKKIRVPLGVIGVIYEARPNVTVDVFSLCFKTGNVAILKGGSDAESSNLAIASVIKRVLLENDINTDALTLLPADRTATEALLNAVGFVDVIIPRGSQSLINYLRNNSKIPVIETGAGIVHTYFDYNADTTDGQQIILNAKTRRVSVCNALDCLLIHQSRTDDLPTLLQPLAEKNVSIYADRTALNTLKNKYPEVLLNVADASHFGTEFLDYKLAIKVVKDIHEAIDHIAEFSSKHSEAILSADEDNISLFLNLVDAAAVYANASTGFTDGAQFGLGAEIGISTQKLHARGPMALEELTSYKWIIKGSGQTRK